MLPTIIIPAFNPNAALLALVCELAKIPGYTILLVDDGSDAAAQPIFEECKQRYGCVVYRHSENRGKGAALKTGIGHAMRIRPGAGFVTADADGQHSAQDILRVARAVQQNPAYLVLGSRNFARPGVPFKSRWGNRITALVFWASCGVRCADTQTGLRGIPARLGQLCIQTAGERFEYEMNFLMAAAKQGLPLLPVPIATIYRPGNPTSHFHPLRDSLLIYQNILRFGASSLISAGADLTLFAVLSALVFGTTPRGLFWATAAARFASGGVNFALNHRWVFAAQRTVTGALVRYAALFVALLLASWALVSLLVTVLPALPAKILADTALFFASYQVQRRFVFGSAPPTPVEGCL